VGGSEEEAGGEGNLMEVREGFPSGAKARDSLAEDMYGLKPVPFSVASLLGAQA